MNGRKFSRKSVTFQLPHFDTCLCFFHLIFSSLFVFLASFCHLPQFFSPHLFISLFFLTSFCHCFYFSRLIFPPVLGFLNSFFHSLGFSHLILPPVLVFPADFATCFFLFFLSPVFVCLDNQYNITKITRCLT